MKEIKLSVTIDNKLAAITITQNDITGLFGLELNIFLRIEGLNEIELYEILLGKRDLSLFGEDYKDVRIIEYKTSFPILFGYRGSTTYKNLTLKELLESIDNYRDWIYYDNGYIFDYSSLNGEFKTDIPFFKDIYFLNVSTSEYSWWDPGININHDLSLILRDLKGIDLVSCITALRRIINIKGEPWIKS